MAKKATFVLLAVAFLMTFAVVGCSKPGVSKENLDKVKVGMTLAEVEKVLGTEKKGVEGGLEAITGKAYVWEDGDKKITVVFKDDKVVKSTAVGL